MVIIHEPTWKGLSAAEQTALRDAVAEGIAWQDAEIQGRERTLLDKFKAAGMEVIQPDGESFRKPVVETLPRQFEAKWGKGLYEKIAETR
jgi:TRAP-type C4-dicarboxylate transport system substrate-binding protein